MSRTNLFIAKPKIQYFDVYNSFYSFTKIDQPL